MYWPSQSGAAGEAVAVPIVKAAALAGVALKEPDGAVATMTGVCISVTVTAKGPHMAILPEASVTVQVILVTPLASTIPLSDLIELGASGLANVVAPVRL